MEGFMAVIRAYSVGIKNCIATMGTALSQEQLQLIKRLSNNVILCYDGDQAGLKATMQNGEQFLKSGLNPKVIVLEDDLDPDDYIIKYGRDDFQNLIDNAINFTDFKLKNIKKDYNLASVSDKMSYINKVLEELVNEKDYIKREIVLKNLAKDTDVWYNTLEKKLLEFDTNHNSKENVLIESVSKKHKTKYEKAMDSLIYYMLNSVEAITLVENSRVFIPSKNISLLVNEIIYYYHKYGRINEADFYIYLEGNEELRKVYHEILQDEYPCEVSSQIVLETLKVIRESSIALEIKRLENLIKNETSVTEQMRLLEEIRVLRMKEGESC